MDKIEKNKGTLAILIYFGYEKTVIDSQVLVPFGLLKEDGYPVSLVFFESPLAYFRSFFQSPSRYRSLNSFRWIRLLRFPRNVFHLNSLQLLIWSLFQEGPIVFHCRGTQASFVALRIKKFLRRVVIACDVRGLEPEEYQYERGGSIVRAMPVLQRFWYFILCFQQQFSLLRSDFLFFVSQSMKRYFNSRFSLPQNHQQVIPCAVRQSDFSHVLLNRNQFKAKWGFDQKLVIVYSGAVGKWHMSEYLPKIFNLIKKNYTDSLFLGLTPQVHEMTQLFESHQVDPKCYRIVSVPHHDVASYLCASDIGLLLREPHPLNAVSFPTKFAEYLASGLHVVTTAAIDDIVASVEQYQVGTVLNLNEGDQIIEAGLISAIKAGLNSENRLRQSTLAASQYDWNQFVSLYKNTYRSYFFETP